MIRHASCEHSSLNAWRTPNKEKVRESVYCSQEYLSGRRAGARMKTTILLRRFCLLALLCAFGVYIVHAQNRGTLRGTVKDPSGASVPDATVTLKAMASAFAKSTQTDRSGDFTINTLPLGEYTLTVEHPGFATLSQAVQIIIGSAPNLQLTLAVGAAASTVTVTATVPLEATAPTASSPPVLVSSENILQTLPGADRMSSLSFITDVTPSAFVLHDHLHIRGGHQIDWIINGVPVPNTNMSSNVGRQMDPKDIEEVQINRGGYGAQTGDRTFGQVNIFTRNGFEFNNDADLTVTYGSFHQTNDQLSFGGHSTKFAYYASVSGNRTDLGLEPPVSQISHALGSGESFFTNMTYNLGPKDQFDWTASVRNDHFQIPVDPNNFDPTDTSYAGLRDVDRELDSFITSSWTHTITSNTLLTVSPFYHYNNGQYIGAPTDPLVANSHNASNYLGSQIELKYVRGPNNLVGGLYGFYQHNNQSFSLEDTTLSPHASATVSAIPTGGVGAAYINDQYKPWRWLTLTGGIRLTHFSGTTSENAANPRIGATVEIPKLHWVLRGFYGTYYQPPPLYTVGGGVFGAALAGSEDFGFQPLHGERDIQREQGLTIPIRGWIVDLAHFATSSTNFLDHDVLGNSNILLPLTTPNARMHGEEVTIRSPQLMRRLRFHLAFSNMVASYKGLPSGGLIEPVPDECLTTFCYLDHDQRNTLTTGFEVQLPWHTYFSGNVVHGSGVLLADGPDHLPPNTVGDMQLGKAIGERWNLGLSVLNVSNSRFPFDINSSFAGNHFNNPREIIGSVRYRFHF